jgi:CubicO group peptidase (beta-lactamase class C family)
LDDGSEPLTTETLFQIGSISKTMTGVLLATAVVRSELTLDTRLSDVLETPGRAGEITMLELATQRSGLPRLPPNLDLAAIDQTDPYAKYTPDNLRDALAAADPGPKEFNYSNFGFMALGLALATASGSPFAQLLRQRIFEPADMTTAGCPPVEDGRATGYAGTKPTPWWNTQLPGPGGVGASIRDLAAYLGAHLRPPAGELGQAVELATTIHAPAPSPMGLGWGHQGGGWFHDGGTGGFTSFLAFHRPTGTAVGLLANGGNLSGMDRAGFGTLTAMIRSAS